jgi:hypothetical protein
MISLNQQFQDTYGKSFLFELRVQEMKIELNFHIQYDNHEGLFFNLSNKYFIHQLKDIVHIEISSDSNPRKFRKDDIFT